MSRAGGDVDRAGDGLGAGVGRDRAGGGLDRAGSGVTVERAGPLTTVQDLGRAGFAHLGVPRSGALDGPALRRANGLVGNPASAAGLETTLLGCALRFSAAARVAVTGARAKLKVDGVVVVPAADGVVVVPAGAVLDVGRAEGGVRSYVAVAGGIDVEPVLGSRSTDTLSGLGPPKLANGDWLALGEAGISGLPGASNPSNSPNLSNSPDPSDQADPSGLAASAPIPVDRSDGGLVLGVWRGPRDDWFVGEELFAGAYRVSPLSNRVGVRLEGAALRRTREGELESEGVVLGAVQVPADGQPLIFLADHPTTGGYPVIGVVDDVTPLAQVRPGTMVRFRALD